MVNELSLPDNQDFLSSESLESGNTGLFLKLYEEDQFEYNELSIFYESKLDRTHKIIRKYSSKLDADRLVNT